MNRSEIVQTPARRSDEIPGRLAYTVPEVAVLMGGVTERYVWTLIDNGQGPLRSFLLGRRRVVYHEDLDAFLRELRDDELRAREAAASGGSGQNTGGGAGTGSGNGSGSGAGSTNTGGGAGTHPKAA